MPQQPEAIVEGKKRPFMGSTRYRKQPLCPQLAEADVSPVEGDSGFDASRKSSGLFFCDAHIAAHVEQIW
jgi:hypothetical protein